MRRMEYVQWVHLLLVGGFGGVFGSGCIPVPALAPPLRAAIALGGGNAGSPKENAGHSYLTGRIALSPLAIAPRLIHRKFDPEIGMVFEGPLNTPNGNPADFGGYLGLGWRLWQEKLDWSSSAGHRVYLRGTVDLMNRTPDHRIGGGGTVAFGWELSWFADTEKGIAELPSDRSPGFLGYAFGQGGFGFEVAGGGRYFGDAAAWQITLGMSVRIPAVLGLLLVPLPKSR